MTTNPERITTAELTRAAGFVLTGDRPVHGRWTDLIAPGGIDFNTPNASDSVITIRLENGQRFTLTVEETR